MPSAVGLSSVLAGRVGAHEAVQPVLGGLFDVLTSGPLPPNPSELLASQQMAAALDGLRERYDVVLVDTPPLLPVTDAAAVAPATDGMILVCRYGRTTRAQVSAAAQALRSVSGVLFGAVLSMVTHRGPGSDAVAYGTSYGALATDADVGPDEVRSTEGTDHTDGSAADRECATTVIPLVALTAHPARSAPSPRRRT